MNGIISPGVVDFSGPWPRPVHYTVNEPSQGLGEKNLMEGDEKKKKKKQLTQWKKKKKKKAGRERQTVCRPATAANVGGKETKREMSGEMRNGRRSREMELMNDTKEAF